MEKIQVDHVYIAACYTVGLPCCSSKAASFFSVFTTLHYASCGIAMISCLSVRLSVMLVDCDHMRWNSSKIISRLISLTFLRAVSQQQHGSCFVLLMPVVILSPIFQVNIYLTDLIYFTAVLIYCLFIFSNFQCVFVMFFWCSAASAAWLEVCFYRAMHFSAFARSCDRMSSVCLSIRL